MVVISGSVRGTHGVSDSCGCGSDLLHAASVRAIEHPAKANTCRLGKNW